ncbi:MAG: FecR family protein [Rhodanobacter sp.]
MDTIDQHFDEHLLLTAADWWTRLRDPHGAEASVEQWLDWTEQDERHLAAFEYIAAFGEGIGLLDADTRRRLLAEFAAKPASMPAAAAAPRRHWWPTAAAAAALAVAIGGGVLLWGRSDGGAMTLATYASAVGQNREVVLPDGSKVTLGGASRLSIRFAGDERHVALEAGEAYFQVVHDAQRPFEVAAGGITVRDIGTAFDVRRDGSGVAVAVTEGQVRVTAADNASRTLDAGAEQRVAWDAATDTLQLGTTTPEQAIGWRQHRLEFVNEPLSVVIASVNRYSAKPVRLDGAAVAGLGFTGTVRTDEIGNWLHALPQVFPLQVQEGEHAVTLSANKVPAQRR